MRISFYIVLIIAISAMSTVLAGYNVELPAGQSLVGAEDQSSQQAIIGVKIGVDTQAHSDHLDAGVNF